MKRDLQKHNERKIWSQQNEFNASGLHRVGLLINYQTAQFKTGLEKRFLNQMWAWSLKVGEIFFAGAYADWDRAKTPKSIADLIERTGFYQVHLGHHKPYAKAAIQQLMQFVGNLSAVLGLDRWVLVAGTDEFVPVVAHLQNLGSQVYLVGAQTRRTKRLVALVDQVQALEDLKLLKPYSEEGGAGLQARICNYYHLGEMYYVQGQYGNALVYFQYVREMLKESGGDLQQEVHILGKIGSVYEAQNQDSKALQYYREAQRLLDRERIDRERELKIQAREEIWDLPRFPSGEAIVQIIRDYIAPLLGIQKDQISFSV
ncbi:MAG: NYN domain-containing protein, partial [Candidatus Hodarchaeota archaeon]